jgi:hypothetical protein
LRPSSLELIDAREVGLRIGHRLRVDQVASLLGELREEELLDELRRALLLDELPMGCSLLGSLALALPCPKLLVTCLGDHARHIAPVAEASAQVPIEHQAGHVAPRLVPLRHLARRIVPAEEPPLQVSVRKGSEDKVHHVEQVRPFLDQPPPRIPARRQLTIQEPTADRS